MPPKAEPAAPKSPKSPRSPLGRDPKKGRGLFGKAADRMASVKESVKIKLGSKTDNIDTTTNEAMVLGGEATSAEVLANYRLLLKAARAATERLEGQNKEATRLESELDGVFALSNTFAMPLLATFGRQLVDVQQQHNRAEGQYLMNGFAGALHLFLDDLVTKKATVVKNSRARYDHALNDYGVAARKAHVRLGKSPDTMDTLKYMEAAVEREISLVNYDRVTREHLEEHNLVAETRNLEFFQELLRSHGSQVKGMEELHSQYVALREPATQLVLVAAEQSERIAADSAEWEASHASDDLRRLVEHHDPFVRALAGANMAVMQALFKRVDGSATAASLASVATEVLFARAFDAWGVSEALLLELVARHPSDETVPLFSGNKTCERLLEGYMQHHLGAWFDACLSPFVAAVVADPQHYVVTRADGFSHLLTWIERIVDRMATAAFPPLFAAMCRAMSGSSMASLVGGRVIKFLLSHGELFGSVRVVEPASATFDVASFVLWSMLANRPFQAIDPTKATSLKITITVAHCMTEHAVMASGWASSSDTPGRLRSIFAQAVQQAPPLAAPTFKDRLEAVSDGGSVAMLLQLCRARLDQLCELLAQTDRNAAFRFSDSIAKASVAVSMMDPATRAASLASIKDLGSVVETDTDDNYEYEYRYVYATDPDEVVSASPGVVSSSPSLPRGNAPPPPRPSKPSPRPPPPSSSPPPQHVTPSTPTVSRGTPPLPARSPRNGVKK